MHEATLPAAQAASFAKRTRLLTSLPVVNELKALNTNKLTANYLPPEPTDAAAGIQLDLSPSRFLSRM